MTNEREYDIQISNLTKRIREASEAKIAAGWAPAIAFDTAVHQAADSDKTTEATVSMMMLAAADLARGWQHSEAFVAWWNGLFPGSPTCEGFAMPAIMEMEDGQTARIVAPWSSFMSLAQRRQA